MCIPWNLVDCRVVATRSIHKATHSIETIITDHRFSTSCHSDAALDRQLLLRVQIRYFLIETVAKYCTFGRVERCQEIYENPHLLAVLYRDSARQKMKDRKQLTIAGSLEARNRVGADDSREKSGQVQQIMPKKTSGMVHRDVRQIDGSSWKCVHIRHPNDKVFQ